MNPGLDRAHRVRQRRATLRQNLKLGRVQPQTIAIDPPDWMATATVEWLLLASPRIGPKKASWVLDQVGLSPTRGLGTLTKDERLELVKQIVHKGWCA